MKGGKSQAPWKGRNWRFMGLDMYLYRKVNVQNWDGTPRERRFAVEVTRGGKPVLDGSQVICVVEEVGYWRKANAVHRWFVETVAGGIDDCRLISVRYEQLAELKQLVDQVLAKPERGPELLPTGAGFFFGSPHYDEDYLTDLRLTAEILDRALASSLGDFEYEASW